MAKQHNPQFEALCAAAKTRISEISATATLAMIGSGDPFFLIDVREESEWAKGHADGAVHVGKGVIERDIENVITETCCL